MAVTCITNTNNFFVHKEFLQLFLQIFTTDESSIHRDPDSALIMTNTKNIHSVLLTKIRLRCFRNSSDSCLRGKGRRPTDATVATVIVKRDLQRKNDQVS